MTTIAHRPARPVTDNWDWQLFAACRGLDVEIFYHPAAAGPHPPGASPIAARRSNVGSSATEANRAHLPATPRTGQ